MKPVNIAMMSLTHGHTRKYYQTLMENPKLKFVAASAENEDVKSLFQKSVPGVPVYDSDIEMFNAHPEIEAAVLASANKEHLRQVNLCAQRGIHILSMKIPTFDLEEYDEMARLVKEAGIVCQVELEMHYNPVVSRLRSLATPEKLGKIFSIQATNITLTPVWAFPWQGDPELSFGSVKPLKNGDGRFCGGALCDHPHIFDMLRHLTGSDFETIYAQAAPNLRTDLLVEDMLSVTGKMKNGTAFSLDPSWSRMEERIKVPGPGWEVYPKRMEVNITINGEKSVLMADCFGPNCYHNMGPNDRYTVQYTYFDEWIGLIDEFVECIHTGAEPMINLSWHRKTIEAMLACYQSIKTGEPITINAETN